MAVERGVIAVLGATGRQGGAVTRHLLADGWQVRALTRDPDSAASRTLAELGAEVVRADMDDPSSLAPAFAGAHGVFSVQNTYLDGMEAELAQGRNVGDVAAASGVRHVVYSGSGPGTPGTGVEAWDAKVAIAEHLRALDLPLTVLRPMAFMELMTDKDFFPPVSAWHLMPRLAGPDRPIPWLAVDDIGALVARAFADPDFYLGADLGIASELRSLGECREIWQRVTGHRPRRFPMPVWLFRRVGVPDLLRMWSWLATGELDADPERTRRLHPGAVGVEEWITRRAGAT